MLLIINKKKKRKIKTSTIEIFNLGSSHSLNSFKYKNINAANLAEISQTFYYDKLMLEKYWNKIEKNSFCFITISYFSFAARKFWLKSDLKRFYRNLDFKYIQSEDKFSYILYTYFPLIVSLKKRITRLIKGKKRKNFEEEALKRASGHLKKIQDKRNLEYNKKLLEDIIKKCQSKNIKVILLTTPFKEFYNQYFSEEILKNYFYKEIKEISKKYKLLYLDFSHDKRFKEKENFLDMDHLSEKGAFLFMKILEEELIKNKIKINL